LDWIAASSLEIIGARGHRCPPEFQFGPLCDVRNVLASHTQEKFQRIDSPGLLISWAESWPSRPGVRAATLLVTHPRWEPYAVKPLVRFRAGGDQRWSSLPRHLSRELSHFVTCLPPQPKMCAKWSTPRHSPMPPPPSFSMIR